MDFAITSAMLEPLTNSLNSGITAIVPIGLTVMGVICGIRLIPKIIKMFL